MELLKAVILGGLFGAVLYAVGASNPKQLSSMLRLEDLSLMKIIVFGIGFASVLLSVSMWLGIFNYGHLNIKSANLGVILGGLIFGIGFGSAGTCPGTCVAGTGGDGPKKAIAAVLGGLLGAFAFTLSYGGLKALGLFNTMDLGKLTLFKISDQFPSVFPFGATGLFLVGLLFMAFGTILPLHGRKNPKEKEV